MGIRKGLRHLQPKGEEEREREGDSEWGEGGKHTSLSLLH